MRRRPVVVKEGIHHQSKVAGHSKSGCYRPELWNNVKHCIASNLSMF